MSLNTAKTVEVMFEKALETHEEQTQILDLVEHISPKDADLQNSGNVVWRPVQQHAPIIEGWDLTGEEQGVIEEAYPAILGTPKNDFRRLRADDLRDKRFWERAGEESGRKQASELNRLIASAIALQGSIFYRSNATNGFDFIGEAQTLMNERQLKNNGRCFILNDRDTLAYASDLSGRETVKGRPETAWAKGQIGSSVAEFDVYTGSYLPNLAGGSDPAATVTGNQSFAPQAGTVTTATGVVTNTDYRTATIAVSASGSYNIGDKVTFSNSGTPVYALGKQDKTNTGQAMTFTIVAKPTSTSITVYPKPIAANDSALSTLEKSYANINTTILNAATVDRKNTDTSNKTNIFWDKSAIEVIGGEIPADLFSVYDGMKVLSSTMKGGQTMYMVYDGDIATMNFRWRIFTWYGITVADPSNCGVGVTYSA